MENKKVLLFVLGFAILGYLAFLYKLDMGAPANSDNNTISYTDPDGIFYISYNKSFSLEKGVKKLGGDWKLDATDPGVLLATITMPKSYMPETNFSSSRLTVGQSTDPKALKSCVSETGEGDEDFVNIDGTPFQKFSFGDAGAGNLYDTRSYHAILDGDCIVIEYTIHSVNIGNYSPDQGIKEFDKAKVQSEFESIVQSFKFLVNSD